MLCICFLLFSFITVFLSIKISYYADVLSSKYNVSKGLVGGLLLAGVTSLPEFITCFSSLQLNNPSLIVGDILGSNLFNIVMISFFDILFVKRFIFINRKGYHTYIYLCLVIIYIIIILSYFNFINFSGMFIFIIYIFYVLMTKKDVNFKEKTGGYSKVLIKLLITSFFLVISSVLLTIVVNKISITYNSFSSSLIGAILLGVTTSLPEVITLLTLINVGNYDLAFSNILGSNMFNFLVLIIGDLFLGDICIFDIMDNKAYILSFFGLIVTFVSMGLNFRKKLYTKFGYIFFSVLILITYFIFWLFNFIY